MWWFNQHVCELLSLVLKAGWTGRVPGDDKSGRLRNSWSRSKCEIEKSTKTSAKMLIHVKFSHCEDFSIMTFQDCWVLKVRKFQCHLNFPIPVGALGIECQGHRKFYPNPGLGCGSEDLTLDTSWNENAIMTFSGCCSALPFCAAENHFELKGTD